MGTQGRIQNLSRSEVDESLKSIIVLIKGDRRISNAFILGSYRRKETGINDADILVLSNRLEEWSAILEHLAYGTPNVTVQACKTKTARLILEDGLQVDIMMTDSVSLPAAKLHFTGSASFNIKCRAAAKRKGMTLNEYGLFRGDVRIPIKSEEDILDKIGIPWHSPEER